MNASPNYIAFSCSDTTVTSKAPWHDRTHPRCRHRAVSLFGDVQSPAPKTILATIILFLGGCSTATETGLPTSKTDDSRNSPSADTTPISMTFVSRVTDNAKASTDDGGEATPVDPRLAERDRAKERSAEYERQGKTVLAIEEAERQLELEIEIFGEQNADVAETLEGLYELYLFDDRLNEARTAITRGKEIDTAIHGKDDWRIRDCQIALEFVNILEKMDPDERWHMLDSEEQSLVMADARRYLDAIEFREDALTGYLKIVGRNHLYTAVMLIEIARSNLALGEYEVAEKQLQDVLRILENTVGTSHPHYGWTLDLLAEHSQLCGDNERAEKYYRRSLDIQEAAFGKHHPNYSTALNNLATLYDSLERYREAVPLYRQALKIIRPAEGNSNRDYDITLTNLARALIEIAHDEADAEQFATCVELLREARDLRAQRFGRAHWLVTNLEIEIEDFAQRAKMTPKERQQWKQADELYDEAMRLDQEEQDYEAALLKAQQAMRLIEQLLGKRHIQFAWKSHKVADLLLAVERYDEAKPLYRGAEAIFREKLGGDDPQLATALADQGRLYYLIGEPESAQSFFDRALAIYDRLALQKSAESDFGFGYDLYYADAMSYRGAISSDMGDYAAAEQMLQRALLLFRHYRDDDPSSYATALYDLGSLYLRMNYGIHAEPLLLESLRVTQDFAGKDAFEYADRLTSLGSLYIDMDRGPEAEQPLKEAVHILETLAPDHEDSLSLALFRLGTSYRLQDRIEDARTLLERVRDIDARFYGTDHTEYAYTLNQLGILYTSAEQFNEATNCFEEALAICLEHGDENDTFCGRILYNHAFAYVNASEYSKAKGLLTRAKKVYEAMVDEDPPSAANEFLDLGTLYDRMEEQDLSGAALGRALDLCRDYISHHDAIVQSELMTLASTLRGLAPIFVERDNLAAALDAGRQLLLVEEKLHGVGHWRFTDARLELDEIQHLATLTADELDTLDRADGALAHAHALLKEDEPSEALKAMQLAHDLYRDALGSSHRETIAVLIELSNLTAQLGRRTDAEPLLAEAVKAREIILGTRHPDYSLIVTKAGFLYRDLGRYTQAEHYLQLAIDIDNDIYGQDHEWYAHDLLNLAGLCNLTGNASQGLPLARQASDIHRRLRGEESSSYLSALNLTAVFYHQLRDFESAQELFVLTLAKRRKTLGEDNADTLTSMNNLAVLFSDTGRYKEAEKLMLRVFEVRKDLFGENSDSVALSMRNLGGLYSSKGDLDRAIRFFEEATRIYREVNGPKHPTVVELQSTLGQIYVRKHDYAQAEPLLLATLETQLESPDQNLADISAGYFSLSRLCYATDRTLKAIEYLDKSLSFDQQLLDRLSTLTERDLQSNYQAQSFKLDHLIAMAASTSNNTAAVREAFDWTLRRKAAVLDTLCRLRAVEDVFDLEPDIAREASRLRELRQQIADLALNPPAGLSPNEIRDHRHKLKQEAQSVESRLRRSLQNRRSTQVAAIPDAEQIRKRLAPHTALVEFIRSSVYDKNDPRSTHFVAEHYFAFVVTATDSNVRMIDLGDGPEIDRLIEELRDMTERTPRGLRQLGESALEASFTELSHELYAKVFRPLLEAIGDSTTVILAPDRAFHMLPFAALVDDAGKYLIEHFQLGYLSTGRDLLRNYNEIGRGTLVFAGPNYDLQIADRLIKANEIRETEMPAFAVATRGEDTAVRAMRWNRLAGAEQEALDVQSAIASTAFGPVLVHSGNDALEEIFKDIHSPRILHVATHGFFIKRREESEAFTENVIPNENRIAAAVGFSRLRNSTDPLLRSGIVLAGANDLMSTGEETPRAEDGWVTAAEIAMLDLRGTELVVLSACESGLGDVSTREGVFGLRRSFFHAGAQSLVTSLFKVPDDETRLLMQRFYQELAQGKTKLDALREAQLSVIKRRREANGAAHPFFWASFILVGNPN